MVYIPIEIVHRILEILIDTVAGPPGYTDDPTYSDYELLQPNQDLFKFRLVCKTWSRILTPILFRTISVDSQYDEFFRETWKDSAYSKLDIFPFKTLTLILEYDDEVKYYNFPNSEDDDYIIVHPISIEQAITWINSLAQNLDKLVLVFAGLMRLTPELIQAINQVKNLDQFSIRTEGFSGDTVQLDSANLDDLFSILLNIKHLAMDKFTPDLLNLKHPALSNLQSFYFSSLDDHLKIVAHLCRLAKDSLKYMAYKVKSVCCTECLKKIFDPIHNTLEGLFENEDSESLPVEISGMEFPKLKVVQVPNSYLDEWVDASFGQPYLRNIRTLVMNFTENDDWEELLRNGNGIKKLKNLKHIIFATINPTANLNPGLVYDLGQKGIKCHLIWRAPPDKFMEMDYQLNGPI